MISYGEEFARTYLFRGKRISDGQWVYGNLLEIDKNCFIVEKVTSLKQCKATLVDPETVSQYIQGYDLDGIKIFEGDIISIYSSKRCGVDDKPVGIGVVIEKGCYLDASNGLGRQGLWCRPQDTVQVKVIGNIWDNFSILGERAKRIINNYHRRVKI